MIRSGVMVTVVRLGDIVSAITRKDGNGKVFGKLCIVYLPIIILVKKTFITN